MQTRPLIFQQDNAVWCSAAPARQSVNIQAKTRRIAPGDGCWNTRIRHRHSEHCVVFMRRQSQLGLHQHPLMGKETLSLSRLIVRTIILQSPQPRLLLLTRGFVFSTPTPNPPLMCQPQTRFTYRNHFKGNEWK